MLFTPKERGQGFLEYALIIFLVVVVVIAILVLLGPAVRNLYQNTINNV